MRIMSAYPVRSATAGVLFAALGGCAGSLNSRDTLGGSVPIEAITPDDASSVRIAKVEARPLTGMDRSAFASRQFVVPVDGVRHQPTYRLTGLPESGRPGSWRDAGDYPDPERALDVRGDEGFEAWNGALAPLAAAAEIALSPIGMIIAPPWSVTQSPAPARAAARIEESPPPTEDAPQETNP